MHVKPALKLTEGAGKILVEFSGFWIRPVVTLVKSRVTREQKD